LKDQTVIHVHSRFAQTAAITFEALVAQGARLARSEGNSFVAQLDQMLSDHMAGHESSICTLTAGTKGDEDRATTGVWRTRNSR
jgi:hypothetical protein